MKIEPRRIAAFLRDPGACGVVLLHGDDLGLVRERAEGLVRAAAGSLDDPFRVADLDRGDAGRLLEEASALSLTGGRRAVRLRDATDAATGAVEQVLAAGLPALVVIEAAALPARSRLRQAVERAPQGAAIACYPDSDQALEQVVRAQLDTQGIAIDADALAWTVSRLGADRTTTRQEIEKLALYAGAGGRVDLDAAMRCLGDLSGLSLDDALFAATEGDARLCDRALALAFAEGAAPVGVLRAALGHLQRLHRLRLLVAGGLGAEDAVKALRPPVFAARAQALRRAIGGWPMAALEDALQGIAAAEAGCKRTGAPAETIARQAVLTLARRAARARG